MSSFYPPPAPLPKPTRLEDEDQPQNPVRPKTGMEINLLGPPSQHYIKINGMMMRTATGLSINVDHDQPYTTMEWTSIVDGPFDVEGVFHPRSGIYDIPVPVKIHIDPSTILCKLQIDGKVVQFRDLEIKADVGNLTRLAAAIYPYFPGPPNYIDGWLNSAPPPEPTTEPAPGGTP